MKKKAAHIFLLVLLVHNLGVDQFLKLPVLFAHFQEHQQRDNRISVMDFLSMHYWGKDLNDDDDDRDNQLPFRTSDLHTVQHSFVPLSRPICLREDEFPILQSNYPILRQNFLPDPALSALFRPPRV